MSRSFIAVIVIIALVGYDICNAKKARIKNAVVTLVMGTNNGFIMGAIALGQSLIDSGSILKRVVMVTPEVDQRSRRILRKVWDDVVEVEQIDCIFKTHPQADAMFDMKGEKWTGTMAKWAPTCTKLAAWSLYDYERIIFMDSDMIAIGLVDTALYEYSNATFLAAPEVLPPDTINSGFMVLEPSKKTFQELIVINKDMGVAWTGDQYIINWGLCPSWHTANHHDTDSGRDRCARLPWIYNVQVLNYNAYSTVQAMTGKPQPIVIHFISDGKPWEILSQEESHPEEVKQYLNKNMVAVAHALWRRFYYNGMVKINPDDPLVVFAKQSYEPILNGPSTPGYLYLQHQMSFDSAEVNSLGESDISHNSFGDNKNTKANKGISKAKKIKLDKKIKKKKNSNVKDSKNRISKNKRRS